jgi:hypothetical protein
VRGNIRGPPLIMPNNNLITNKQSVIFSERTASWLLGMSHGTLSIDCTHLHLPFHRLALLGGAFLFLLFPLNYHSSSPSHPSCPSLHPASGWLSLLLSLCLSVSEQLANHPHHPSYDFTYNVRRPAVRALLISRTPCSSQAAYNASLCKRL